VILEVQPGHDAARELVGEIETLASVGHSETAEHAVEAVTPATTGDLARRFRDALGGRSAGGPVSRLVSWLERMRRNRGERRDR
jgi:hypothetical protein